jgi:hypothetical protein
MSFSGFLQLGPIESNLNLSASSSTGTSSSNVLPNEIMEKVFQLLEVKDLLQCATPVCRRWYSLASDPYLWHQRCLREGKCSTSLTEPEKGWKYFYFTSYSGRNLITNPCGDDRLQGWHIIENGGDGWEIENKGAECPATVAMGCQCNFVTSYEWCRKAQVIDLKRYGFSETQLDSCPPIEVSEWFCARWDCGSDFQLHVKLFDGQRQMIDEWNVSELAPIEVFKEWKHTFTNYRQGVRYVEFEDAGKDTNWWAGHYGAKMTAASVIIHL